MQNRVGRSGFSRIPRTNASVLPSPDDEPISSTVRTPAVRARRAIARARKLSLISGGISRSRGDGESVGMGWNDRLPDPYLRLVGAVDGGRRLLLRRLARGVPDDDVAAQLEERVDPVPRAGEVVKQRVDVVERRGPDDHERADVDDPDEREAVPPPQVAHEPDRRR